MPQGWQQILWSTLLIWSNVIIQLLSSRLDQEKYNHPANTNALFLKSCGLSIGANTKISTSDLITLSTLKSLHLWATSSFSIGWDNFL
jgi:hypothetical protein